MKHVDYELMCRQMEALAEGVDYGITNLANAAALLFETMDRLNWAGFYLLRGESLLLGPFQGKTACTRIAVGKGVCGASARERRTIRVRNVHEFPGHIACDGASNSEIVVPLFRDGKLFAVMDLDSPELDRFSEEDERGLEQFAEVLGRILSAFQDQKTF